jgi:glucose-6-phosphate 1-dehydrogenase
VFLRNPGLTEEQALTELDLTYKSRFSAEGKAPRIPGAYERLVLDVIKGTPAGNHLKMGVSR